MSHEKLLRFRLRPVPRGGQLPRLRRYGGKPFGGTCVLGECCKAQGCETPGSCFSGTCAVKEQLIREFNDLHIPHMGPVDGLKCPARLLHQPGVHLARRPEGKVLEDGRVYLGNQLEKQDGSCRCATALPPTKTGCWCANTATTAATRSLWCTSAGKVTIQENELC